MFTKPEFRPFSQDDVFGLIEANMFATVVSYGPSGLVASHLPFLLDGSRGPNGTLTSHLARINAHAQYIVDGRETLVVFQGTHGYISSSWYPAEPVRDSAPTWNFAVVHCHGTPVALGEKAAARHLLALVEQLEQGRSARWRMSELGPGGLDRRLPNIVAFDLPIERLEAKFKMGQDERPRDTAAAINALSDHNPTLAKTMARYSARRREQ
jgi:transcriptional regulator